MTNFQNQIAASKEPGPSALPGKTLLGALRPWMSIVIPILVLLVFHGRGLVEEVSRIQPVYGWTMNQPSDTRMAHFNQDMVQGTVPNWFRIKKIRENGSETFDDTIYAGIPISDLSVTLMD